MGRVINEVPITVYHGGSHPPDGRDVHEELQKSQYNRVGLQASAGDLVSKMLAELVATEHNLKTGVKVRITMEIVRRTRKEEYSHINCHLHEFQALTGRVSLQQYWDEHYDQYKTEGTSLYECLCRDLGLDPIGGFINGHGSIKL